MTKPRCPFCGEEMQSVFVMMSGGTLLSASRLRIRRTGRVARKGFPPPTHEELKSAVPNEEPPLHCVVGGGGYSHGTWPKDGFYCKSCGSFSVKVKPY